MQLIKQLQNGNSKVQLKCIFAGVAMLIVIVTIIALTNNTFATNLLNTLKH